MEKRESRMTARSAQQGLRRQNLDLSSVYPLPAWEIKSQYTSELALGDLM